MTTHHSQPGHPDPASPWVFATRELGRRPGNMRAYSRHIQAEVAPGQLATFVYSFKVPLTVTSGIYRFHGDLAQATTGTQIHPEGYYQEATCACP